ncbi:pyrroloquinoline quinone-dependent dehydrogenase [uncultured Paludibaculum sp.]|uniref:pyrroloquinoline quinone-dependent dehydrogenase n=1 Tax=uncultured Paludibaculum sp. TaxID=1765020 RepID=UPI002AAB558D|nr:pyrroloquinoline quinone-dependent dehydrogenase [uncultured Paludibaculum sp.]
MNSRRLLLLGACASSLLAQTDWPVYGHDPGASRFSPLNQINVDNVNRLQHTWTFHTGKPGSEGIPVVVGGVMYVTATNGVFALEPETGRQLWHYEAAQVALRGLAYWPGAKNTHPRVFVGVKGGMIALDARTGRPAPGFANEGLLDLRQGVLGDLPDAKISLQSPPSIYRDIVITGSANGEGSPSQGAYGDIRGWDARTGKLVWSFHTVPRPGEPGSETWPVDGWKNRSGTNAWGFITIDVPRGIVYVPLGSPTSDFYGADRHGNGLYGNSLVALDAATGKLKWYQQLVHHDLWDFDPAAPPILFDARVTGKVVPAVAQVTKMGLLFAFDRVTGKPLYGMEERPVPQTTVPGEKTSPTQPFPLKPPPLSRIEFAKNEIYSRTPEHAGFCRDLFERNQMRPVPLYTPFELDKNVLMFPSTLGGGSWGGASANPTLGYLYVNVNNLGQWGHMERKGDTYIRTSEYGPYARFWNRDTRIPCTNPPFGELVAIDTHTGDIAWRAPLGTVPALEALGVHNTGAPNLGGSIATAGGLVFIAATNDSRFRAFDAKSGKLLWEQPIDANGHTIPITYLGKDGKQYVTIMAGGGGGFFGGSPADSVMTFALGKSPAPAILESKVQPQVRKTPVVLPDGPGKAMIQKTCGGPCHTLDTVFGMRRTRAGWAAMVDNMIARGANAKEAEARAIVDYLATHFGL